MSRISRAHNPLLGDAAPEITVATAVADSETIDMRAFAMMRYRRVSGSVATLTWFESDSADGPWVRCRVEALEFTTPAGDYWNNLPLDAAGAHFLRAQGDAAGVLKVALKG